jgi:hypothetical protein
MSTRVKWDNAATHLSQDKLSRPGDCSNLYDLGLGSGDSLDASVAVAGVIKQDHG